MEDKSLKIITWNVNGIRAIHKKGNLIALIKNESPDLLLLQETKANLESLPEELRYPPDYKAIYHSAEKKGYSGTSIWVREKLFSETNNQPQLNHRKGMDKLYDDREGRVLTIILNIHHKNYAFISTYMPNGGKSKSAWEDKLLFYERFLDYVNQLGKDGYEVIWGGDVNCAHQEIDLARPKDNEGKIGFHPLERKAISKIIDNSWVDIWRHYNPNRRDVYSWWHLRTRARERNIGWRIDYFFCPQSLIKNVTSIKYLNEVMGSDHCPLVLQLKVS